MTIEEMHVWFRQNAQQMGMQNVRAILPEQIDLLINTSITDTVNQIIQQNIGITNDRVITDNSKISQINALAPLYKVLNVNIVLAPDVALTEGTVLPFTKHSAPIIYYSADIDKLNGTGGFTYLYLVDFSINYGVPSSEDEVKTDTFESNWFPVRLIDDAYLADTLNDFILRPRLRTPIAVIYNNKIDIYIDKKTDNGGLELGLEPRQLRVSYIAKPNQVRYVSDLSGTNEDCDLPEYLHYDILKHALDLYRTSMQGDLYARQQAAQQQQRENYRNYANAEQQPTAQQQQ